MNAVQSRACVSYIEPVGYDMDQVGTFEGSNGSLAMLTWEDTTDLERWFDGPVQMSLRAALTSLVSCINFYANQGLRSVTVDYDNQPLLWMSKMSAKEGGTFLETCINILQKQNQLTYDPMHKTMKLRDVTKIM